MATTTNMDLTVPDVGEAGPGWAEEINADLATIDSHDHSPGKGATVSIENIAGAGTMARQDADDVAITAGTIAVTADPTADLQVATKHYVDAAAGSAITALTGDVEATGPGSVSAGLKNIPADCPAIQLLMTTAPEPTQPDVNKARVYVDETSHTLSVKNGDGNISHTVATRDAVTSHFITAINDDGSTDIGSVSSDDISDATAAGKALLTAADADAQLTDLGATADGKAILTAASALAQAQHLGTIVGNLAGNRVSVAPVGANTDNWAPSGYDANTGILYINASNGAAGWSINGLTGGSANRVLIIAVEIGAGSWTFHATTSSTAANRLANKDVTIPAGSAALFFYDDTESRWYELAQPALYPSLGSDTTLGDIQFNWVEISQDEG